MVHKNCTKFLFLVFQQALKGGDISFLSFATYTQTFEEWPINDVIKVTNE